MDFTILEVARLGPTDLAKMLKINRVTVSQWVHGHSRPHTLLEDRVRTTLDAIRQAVSVGKLPVPYDVPPRSRWLYIQTALGLEPPPVQQD